MTNRIEKSIDLAAPVERVWRALTDHVEFGEWFRVKLEGPFTPGQPAAGHMTHAGYEHVRMEIQVVRMEPPQLFSFNWHPYAVDPAVDYSQEPPTLVEFRLAPTATGTRLEVVETGFDALPEGRRPDALRMNDNGWAKQMLNIKSHVER
jgi:uncharacterized protein YndB with AHSA1/START domain